MSCRIGESSLDLASAHVQTQSLGRRDSQEGGVHCRIVRHRMGSGMEDRFPDRKLGISSKKYPFFTHIEGGCLYFSRFKSKIFNAISISS